MLWTAQVQVLADGTFWSFPLSVMSCMNNGGANLVLVPFCDLIYMGIFIYLLRKRTFLKELDFTLLSWFRHIASSLLLLVFCLILRWQLPSWTAALGTINKTLPSQAQLWGCSMYKNVCAGGRDGGLSLYVFVIQSYAFTKTWDLSGWQQRGVRKARLTLTLPSLLKLIPNPLLDPLRASLGLLTLSFKWGWGFELINLSQHASK